jgi:TetR/AcrR family transcriptional regulator, mexCD-oprJ operon repressor
MNKADEHRRRVAEGNADAILDAALDLHEHDPKPSFVQIARAAGVSRPTLYAHFPTREDLAVAVVRRAVERTAADFRAARLEDDSAPEALDRLLTTAWQSLSGRHRTVAGLARELPADVRREAHEAGLAPILEVVERGQRDGDFRDDQPAGWLVSVLYALIHAAADDVAGGRLEGASAGELVSQSVRGAFSPRRPA